MEKIDFDNLSYPEHDSKVIKEISYVDNLQFKNNLINKNIKIDNQLSIIGGDKERTSIVFLKEFLKYAKGGFDIHHRGSYFLYKFGNERKYFFEGQDRVRRFLTAIRIYKNTECDCNIHFSIGNTLKNKYYRPFNLSTNRIHSYKDRSSIDSRKEFNKIKAIYFKLGQAKFEDSFYYSKLYNAVKFFNHSYDENWTLLKVTLAFTALESLFSDSTKTEVIYKISLRVSYFLHPKEREKRIELFNFLKYGYDIRSYFVHGSNVEKQVKKVMDKIGIQKKTKDYSFHHQFVVDLSKIVCACLTKALLDENYFNFFTNIKISSKEESEFYDSLVLR